MSDTPRTDKHVADIGADGLADGDFARQLERDLAAMTEIAQALRKLHEKPSCAIGEVGAVIARLDEACGK